MKNLICMHYYVGGKVQGVWFRATTKEKAESLKITGWVRNLPDGRVEVLACGEKDALKNFQAWLKRGPQLAKVDEMSAAEVDWQNHNHFEVR